MNPRNIYVLFLSASLVNAQVTFPGHLTVEKGINVCAIAANGTDTYACSIPGTLGSYQNGGSYVVKPDVANTGAATLAVDGLAAKGIIRPDGAALENGDIKASRWITLMYDSAADKLQLTGAMVTGGTVDPPETSGTGCVPGPGVWIPPTGGPACAIADDSTAPYAWGGLDFPDPNGSSGPTCVNYKTEQPYLTSTLGGAHPTSGTWAFRLRMSYSRVDGSMSSGQKILFSCATKWINEGDTFDDPVFNAATLNDVTPNSGSIALNDKMTTTCNDMNTTGNGEPRDLIIKICRIPSGAGGRVDNTAATVRIVDFTPGWNYQSGTTGQEPEIEGPPTAAVGVGATGGGSGSGDGSAHAAGDGVQVACVAGTCTFSADPTYLGTLGGSNTWSGDNFMSLGQGYAGIEMNNAPSTGTEQYKLAKMDSNGQAVRAATSDTAGIIGICGSSCGTSGTGRFIQMGRTDCVFDNSPAVLGGWVVLSTTAAGQCHYQGTSRPSSGFVVGRVAETGGGAGTFQVLLAGGDIL